MRPATLILFISAAVAAAQAPATAPASKSAQDESAAAVAKAKADYDAAVKQAVDTQRAKLKAVLDERTKAGDLDGAIAVREVLKGLDEPEPVRPPATKESLARDRFAAAVSKVVWRSAQNGWGGKTFTLAPDGYVHLPPEKKTGTTWTAIAPGTVVVLASDGTIDVFLIDLVKGTVKVRGVGVVSSQPATWEATKVK